MNAAGTHCTFKVMQRELLEYLLLWLFVFPLNVNVLHLRRMQVFVFYFCPALNP
jgi:hypothetical protein